MTVATQQSRVQYLTDGTTTTFAVPYYFFLATDLRVAVTNTTTDVTTVLNLNSDYTVSGAGAFNGGSINTSNILPAGSSLDISRVKIQLLQALDLVPNGVIPSQSLEATLDNLTMMVQQMADYLACTIQIPIDLNQNAQLILPPVAQRANMFMAFDNNGNATVAEGIDQGVQSVTSSDTTNTVAVDNTDIENPVINFNLGNSVDGLSITYNPATKKISSIGIVQNPTAGDICIVNSQGIVQDSGKAFSNDGTMGANSSNLISTQAAILKYIQTNAMVANPTAGDFLTTNSKGNPQDSGISLSIDASMGGATPSNKLLPSQTAVSEFVANYPVVNAGILNNIVVSNVKSQAVDSGWTLSTDATMGGATPSNKLLPSQTAVSQFIATYQFVPSAVSGDLVITTSKGRLIDAGVSFSNTTWTTSSSATTLPTQTAVTTYTQYAIANFPIVNNGISGNFTASNTAKQAVDSGIKQSIDVTMGGGNASNLLLPTQKAVRSFVNAMALGLIDLRGSWNATTNLTSDGMKLSAAGGTGTGTPIVAGNAYFVNVGGTQTILSPTVYPPSGSYTFTAGDLVYFPSKGDGWDVIDGSIFVTSVNGMTGAVTINLDTLPDVSLTTLATGNVLTWNGTNWTNEAPLEVVTSVNGQTGAVKLALDNILDVALTTLTNGQALIWNGTNWVNETIQDNVISVNGQTGKVVLELTDLPDVTITTPVQNQVISYDAATGQWINGEFGGVESVNGMTGKVIINVENLNDALISSPSEGQALIWDATAEKWINSEPSIKFDDIQGLDITDPQNNQVLVYSSQDSSWVNQTLPSTSFFASDMKHSFQKTNHPTDNGWWMIANGQAITQAQFPQAYAIFGATLPNLTGKTLAMSSTTNAANSSSGAAAVDVPVAEHLHGLTSYAAHTHNDDHVHEDDHLHDFVLWETTNGGPVGQQDRGGGNFAAWNPTNLGSGTELKSAAGYGSTTGKKSQVGNQTATTQGVNGTFNTDSTGTSGAQISVMQPTYFTQNIFIFCC